MALTGEVPGSLGVVIGFTLLRGSKSDARSIIPSKPRLWSQVVMDMA